MNWEVRSKGIVHGFAVYTVHHNGELVKDNVLLDAAMQCVFSDGEDAETWGEFDQNASEPYSSCTVAEFWDSHLRSGSPTLLTRGK